MGIVITLIGLHGVYFIYIGLRYLQSFFATDESIYLLHSTSIIIGTVLFLSAIGLDSKKLISYYSTIAVYCLLIIKRTINGINYFITNGFTTIEFIGLIIGNVLMAWVCYYIFNKRHEIDY